MKRYVLTREAVLVGTPPGHLLLGHGPTLDIALTGLTFPALCLVSSIHLFSSFLYVIVFILYLVRAQDIMLLPPLAV